MVGTLIFLVLAELAIIAYLMQWSHHLESKVMELKAALRAARGGAR
jgi:hypothetical protein